MAIDFEREDKEISEFLNSIGPWRKHVVIGGGYALLIYKLYLADQKIKNPPVRTADIDTLISRRVPQVSAKDIAKHLYEAGYTRVFKDLDEPATAAYVKHIDGLDMEIEFLTDTSTRNNKNKNAVIAGIVAQPLSYLSLSLQKTMEFQTRSNETGLVVSPGTWMFRKALTFTRRKNKLKMLKDLYGIWYTASQLGDFSELAVSEFNILARQNPKWFKTIQKNVLGWMEDESPAKWSMLETQDPSGALKRLEFLRIIQKLSISSS